MRETSGTMRQKYIDDVLVGLPEEQKSQLLRSFDSGIAVGMVAGAEVVYAAVDELQSSALFMLNRAKQEGSKEAENTERR